MSRFTNLEMGSESGSNSECRPVIEDEACQLDQARCAFEKGDFERALRAYSKALEFNARSVPAWLGQVRMLIELGEFNEAKLWAEKALGYFPEEGELMAAKASALARLGDVQAALAYSDAAINGRSDTPYIWLARGDVLLALKEKRADYCFDEALAMASGSWVFSWLASRTCFFYQKIALALKHAQHAMQNAQDQSVLWFQQGLCQKALGLETQASLSFEQALQLNPENLAARLALIQRPATGVLQSIKQWWCRRSLK
jgi:tetratricopeptide (TPR) repeat protein